MEPQIVLLYGKPGEEEYEELRRELERAGYAVAPRSSNNDRLQAHYHNQVFNGRQQIRETLLGTLV